MSKRLTHEIAPLTQDTQMNCLDIVAEKICRKMSNIPLKRSKLHYIIVFPFTLP